MQQNANTLIPTIPFGQNILMMIIDLFGHPDRDFVNVDRGRKDTIMTEAQAANGLCDILCNIVTEYDLLNPQNKSLLDDFVNISTYSLPENIKNIRDFIVDYFFKIYQPLSDILTKKPHRRTGKTGEDAIIQHLEESLENSQKQIKETYANLDAEDKTKLGSELNLEKINIERLKDLLSKKHENLAAEKWTKPGQVKHLCNLLLNHCVVQDIKKSQENKDIKKSQENKDIKQQVADELKRLCTFDREISEADFEVIYQFLPTSGYTRAHKHVKKTGVNKTQSIVVAEEIEKNLVERIFAFLRKIFRVIFWDWTLKKVFSSKKEEENSEQSQTKVKQISSPQVEVLEPEAKLTVSKNDTKDLENNLTLCLTSMPKGAYYRISKVVNNQKGIGNHVALLYKTDDENFRYFEPNYGIYDLEKHAMLEKLKRICKNWTNSRTNCQPYGNYNVVIIDNKEFLGTIPDIMENISLEDKKPTWVGKIREESTSLENQLLQS
jgi:hypothetical protein